MTKKMLNLDNPTTMASRRPSQLDKRNAQTQWAKLKADDEKYAAYLARRRELRAKKAETSRRKMTTIKGDDGILDIDKIQSERAKKTQEKMVDPKRRNAALKRWANLKNNPIEYAAYQNRMKQTALKRWGKDKDKEGNTFDMIKDLCRIDVSRLEEHDLRRLWNMLSKMILDFDNN